MDGAKGEEARVGEMDDKKTKVKKWNEKVCGSIQSRSCSPLATLASITKGFL